MEQETFIFGHGATPVPAHRHLNPDGSLGGWVAETASVAPTCFVGREAQVCGGAKVQDNASIFGEAIVHGRARIFGSARVFDNARVSGTAWVGGHADVYGNSCVHQNPRIFGFARILGNAEVLGNAMILDRAEILGRAMVFDDARVFEEAKVSAKTRVFGRARVFGKDDDGGYVWDWIYGGPPPLSEQRDLARDILERVIEEPDALNMSRWHSTCGTSHCIAGWAQVLRGESIGIDPSDSDRAYECGVRLLPAMAPFFFEEREVALMELHELAAE